MMAGYPGVTETQANDLVRQLASGQLDWVTAQAFLERWSREASEAAEAEVEVPEPEVVYGPEDVPEGGGVPDNFRSAIEALPEWSEGIAEYDDAGRELALTWMYDQFLTYAGDLAYLNFNQAFASYDMERFLGDLATMQEAVANLGGGDPALEDPVLEDPVLEDPALEDPTWDPLEEFGFMADFLNHPELGKIIRDCAAVGCDEQSFMDLIYETDWWKETENADIQFQLMENWQPAQADAMKDAQAAMILKIADQLDINIDPARLKIMARNSIVESWTTDDMNRKILSEASWVMGEAGGGSIGANMRVVGSLVDKYFIPHSPVQIEEFARKLWLGDETEGGLEAYFADLAKGQFPSLATHIDRGYTVGQIFDPYAQRIGNLLEIPASSIDFVNDQRFLPIIDHIGSENEHRPMTLHEMGQYVRTLDDWQYTNNAQTSARELADFIGKKFGSIG
jgi:hypothetical protein